jgi:hypothetical protein
VLPNYGLLPTFFCTSAGFLGFYKLFRHRAARAPLGLKPGAEAKVWANLGGR